MLNQNFADSGIPRVSQIVRDLVLPRFSVPLLLRPRHRRHEGR